MTEIWDCIVVGGGAAGLSAGLVLGRARRRTLVIDAGAQSNLPAHGIGGLLGHDGRPPAELYALGRRELTAYPNVEVRTGEVLTGAAINGGWELELADGRRERTRRVLLATGARCFRRRRRQWTDAAGGRGHRSGLNGRGGGGAKPGGRRPWSRCGRERSCQRLTPNSTGRSTTPNAGGCGADARTCASSRSRRR